MVPNEFHVQNYQIQLVSADSESRGGVDHQSIVFSTALPIFSVD